MSQPLISTVTQSGVTKSQPGVSVSRDNFVAGKVQLRLFRYYPNLRNRIGGLGKIAYMADNGRLFDTVEEYTAFCLERGYLQVYRRQA